MRHGWNIEVYRDLAGEYRWRITARNGQIVATSGEAFATKGNAERAAEMVEARVDMDGPEEHR